MRRAGVLPGFGLTLGFTLLYLGLIVVAPLATLFTGVASFSLASLQAALLSPRVLAAFRLSLGASLGADRLQTFCRVILPRPRRRSSAARCSRSRARWASTAPWSSSPATCRCAPRPSRS